MKYLLIILTLIVTASCSNDFEPQKDIDRLIGAWEGERETTEDIFDDILEISQTHIKFYSTGRESGHVITYIDNEYILKREKIITLERNAECNCLHSHGGTTTYSFDGKYLNFSFTGKLKKKI